jgi:hypothetical protein
VEWHGESSLLNKRISICFSVFFRLSVSLAVFLSEVYVIEKYFVDNYERLNQYDKFYPL